MNISDLDRQFNLDYARYHALISEIISGDLSVEEDIKQISFSEVMRFNRFISLNDILLSGHSKIIDYYGDTLRIAKESTIAFIMKYWYPLVEVCYNCIYSEEFQSCVAYSNEYDLLFVPTKINKVYTLADNFNNLIYICNIYDREVKCIDQDTNKVKLILPGTCRIVR